MEVWLPTTSHYGDITVRKIALRLIVAATFVDEEGAELYLKDETEDGEVEIKRVSLAPEFGALERLEDWMGGQDKFDQKTALIEGDIVGKSRARSYVCPNDITEYTEVQQEVGDNYWAIYVESNLVGALAPSLHAPVDMRGIVEDSWAETITEQERS